MATQLYSLQVSPRAGPALPRLTIETIDGRARIMCGEFGWDVPEGAIVEIKVDPLRPDAALLTITRTDMPELDPEIAK